MFSLAECPGVVLGPLVSVGDPGHSGQCPHCGHNTKHGDTGDDGTPPARTRCLETRRLHGRYRVDIVTATSNTVDVDR